MVECSSSLIESASMPRVRESETLEIEMVAEFVAKCTQERAERCDLRAHRRPHPDADQHGLGSAVAEKLC
jgi:hypothetical protein